MDFWQFSSNWEMESHAKSAVVRRKTIRNSEPIPLAFSKPLAEAIGKQLRELRQSKDTIQGKMTQEKAGKLLKMHQGTLSRIEKGEGRVLSITDLFAICAAYELPFTRLKKLMVELILVAKSHHSKKQAGTRKQR